MRRLNNLVTLFCAMFAFFFGCFLTTTLTNIDKCSTKSESKLDQQTNEIFLIIIILSAPSYFERRNSIRNTWLKLGKPLRQPYFPEENVYLPQYDDEGFLQLETVAEQANSFLMFLDWMNNVGVHGSGTTRNIRIKHFFVIGTRRLSSSHRAQLYKEQNSYEDLLLLNNLEDNYLNLTSKLLMSIENLVKQYNFGYIMKSDDDSYIKLDYVLNELVSYDRKLIRSAKSYGNDPLPELYWGYFNGKAQIKSRGQWKELHYNLCDRYIPYALGGGYIFSRMIAEHIEKNAKLLSTYVSEDISLGTWIAPLRNVYRRHDARFDTGYIPRKCGKHHIVLHKRTIEQMKDLYEERYCTFESANEKLIKRPLEYHYNWKKPSDQCCNTIA